MKAWKGRERQSERKLGGRTEKKKKEKGKKSRTPWLLTSTVCSKHSSFIPLSSFCSPFIKRICRKNNTSEEFHQAEKESSHFASTRLGNVSNADFFLNCNAANAVKRAIISLQNITDFHQGITITIINSYSADEKHISDCKRRQKAQFVFWSQRICFYFHLSNQALITSLTMTNSWLTKFSVCWEASF